MKHHAVLALALAVGLLSTTVLDAQAGVRNRSFNRGQYRQQERIMQGVNSGELTKHEAHQLERGQNRLNKLEQQYKSDGNLTASERAKLNAVQAKQSRHIYAQKHDNQERP